jgi:hypothetical protein
MKTGAMKAFGIYLLCWALVTAPVAQAAEIVWRPKAKTIYGLININRSLEESQYRRKIAEHRDTVNVRQKDLSAKIADLTQRVKLLEKNPEYAPPELDTSAPVADPGELQETTQKEISLAESEFQTNAEILKRLDELELILTSDSFTRLYNDFLLEIEKREAPQKSDGLHHLNLLVAYAHYLEGESFHHKALRSADHRLEFQKFTSELVRQQHPLVEFLGSSFSHNIFDTESAPKTKALPILRLDLSMSKAGALVGVACAAAILAAGLAYNYSLNPAPDRAIQKSQPFIQSEPRGRERHNLPDGDQEAQRALDAAAERAAKFLE